MSSKALRVIVFSAVLVGAQIISTSAGYALTFNGPYATLYWNVNPAQPNTTIVVPFDISQEPVALPNPPRMHRTSPAQVQPAYFWSTQFWPIGSNDDGGYIGVQDDSSGTRVVVSWWAATGASTSNPNATATSFFEGGPGYHVILPFSLQQGTWYKLHGTLTQSVDGSSYWDFQIEDTTSGAFTDIGTIVVPSTWGSALQGLTDSWTEYYGPQVSSCAQLPLATTFFGPNLIGDVIAATGPEFYYGTTGGCPTSEVATGYGGFSQTVGST